MERKRTPSSSGFSPAAGIEAARKRKKTLTADLEREFMKKFLDLGR